MRAERDDDEYVPRRRHQERRLAHEIAIGIILGGLGLAVIQGVLGVIVWLMYMHQVKVVLGLR